MIISFTEYHSLIAAIPKEWMTSIKESAKHGQYMVENYRLIDKIDDSKTASRMLYTKFVKSKIKPPADKAQKWNTDLNIKIDLNEYLSQVEPAPSTASCEASTTISLEHEIFLMVYSNHHHILDY